jgi:small-conductance mechanosensitive channel
MGLEPRIYVAGAETSFLVLCLLSVFAYAEELPTAADHQSMEGVPLMIGNRTIHVFRVPFGMFTAEERAHSASRRIEAAFQRSGEGWTSIRPGDQGLLVELDGQPLFYVLPGDARDAEGETSDELANQASRLLQKAWSESRERSDPQARLNAFLKLGLAIIVLVFSLFIVIKLATWLRLRLISHMRRWVQVLLSSREHRRMNRVIPHLLDRLFLLLTWLIGLSLVFAFLTYSLTLFVTTRSTGEVLAGSIGDLAHEILSGMTAALPGMFGATLIFLMAWMVTRISTEFFIGAATRPADKPGLNAHTAPATRRIVNAALWLFALAMAYPYLPGSHTEAFKGLSVILGLMVSIGAAGVVGQIASGIIIVYTYALKVGEYVRTHEHEGAVTEVSLFVTRLRTGLGEEISIPNAVVLSNVTRNFSRVAGGKGYVLDTTVTIGYDTPWRQVHALLIGATKSIPEILVNPAAYVVQTALTDFYVAYKLVVHVDTDVPATRARVAGDLHAAIQDEFNRQGVQIMSPHYLGDPLTPKLVAETNWYAAPADKDQRP